ncbi:SFRICE_001354 [Gryllus bimaculatus]|nr:SFRICE_001354 [Gryllus bimaculatus]
MTLLFLCFSFKISNFFSGFIVYVTFIEDMGTIITKSMEENLRRNQEFITEMNKITVERQIQMQNQMRERMTAMQIARARELLYWFGSFYALATLGMVAGFRRTRKPGVLIPLLPLTFITAYQADMAYGNKLHRLRAEAENIMQFETDLLELPCGLPTASTIDQARLDTDEKKKFHPSVPPLHHDLHYYFHPQAPSSYPQSQPPPSPPPPPPPSSPSLPSPLPPPPPPPSNELFFCDRMKLPPNSILPIINGAFIINMGSIVTKSMEQSFRKNQELMIEMNKIAVERQIQMQNQMRERATAVQIARARDLVNWIGSFYTLAALGIIVGFRRTRKPIVFVPLLPLTFVTAYHIDMAYGNKLHRLRVEAENIMQSESDLLALPCGLPTTSSIDQARLKTHE